MTAVPPADAPLAGMRRLLAVMRRLRDPVHGCPWDLAQDARSLARFRNQVAHDHFGSSGVAAAHARAGTGACGLAGQPQRQRPAQPPCACRSRRA